MFSLTLVSWRPTTSKDKTAISFASVARLAEIPPSSLFGWSVFTLAVAMRISVLPAFVLTMRVCSAGSGDAKTSVQNTRLSSDSAVPCCRGGRGVQLHCVLSPCAPIFAMTSAISLYMSPSCA